MSAPSSKDQPIGARVRASKASDDTLLPDGTKLFEKVLALFPDGPPSPEVRDAILKEEGIGELTSMERGMLEEITMQDNDKALHIEMPAGTRVDATRQGKQTWQFEIQSPPAPSGERVGLKFTILGTGKFDSSRVDMHLAMAAVSGDMMTIKKKLCGLIARYGDGTIDGGNFAAMPEAFRAAYEVMCSPVELRFNTLYKVMNTMLKKDKVVDFSYLSVPLQTIECPSIVNIEGRWFGDFNNPIVENRIKAVLACIAMHEISWEHYTGDLIRYEEILEERMAKNAGGSRWYYISGNRKNISKIVAAFNNSSIFNVLGAGEELYCWLQEREWKFLSDIVKGNSCRVKEAEEPPYGETKCGKFHISPGAHSRKCNACKRAETNERRAAETKATLPDAPVAEIAQNGKTSKTSVTYTPDVVSSTDARSGPVITVQGPSQADADDYATLAFENRRVADELMERATYYEKLADHYEALLQPTPAVHDAEIAMAEAVQKAQEILDEAKAKAQADRDDQKAALDALIADGPPV